MIGFATPATQLNQLPLRSFRVGSGALHSDNDYDNKYYIPYTGGRASAESSVPVQEQTHLRGRASAEPQVKPFIHHTTIVLMALIALIVIYMMPQGQGQGGSGGGNSRDFNYRIPPTWSPENDSHYTFRAYMTDMSLWIMLTDLQPHQHAAAIVMRLGGTAREMARMITPPELMYGGVRNGVSIDPVTYLLGALQERFAALDEEARLARCLPSAAVQARLSTLSLHAMR